MRSSFHFRPWRTAALAAVLLLAGCQSKSDPGPGPSPNPNPNPNPGGTGDVTVYLTTPDPSGARLNKLPLVTLFRADNPNAGTGPYIDVDDAQRYQPIDGFGAALTGSAANLLMTKQSAAQREALLRELFTVDAQGNGIGLNYVRMTIGASDFSTSSYTYNDLPPGQTDPQQARFSLAPDQAEVIPALVQARQLNPGLKILGSPWSAPAWMKSSQRLIGGQLNPSAYPAYAQYFVKYVQGMQAAGAPVDAVTIQNEPLFEPPGYPGMLMSAAEQADFIKNHLGPAFQQNGLSTKIICYDHNWDQPGYPLAVLGDAGAAQYVDGSAFHGYGGNVSAMSQVRNAFPNKNLYFTEISGGRFSPNFGSNLRFYVRELIVGATRNWSRNVLFWNLALDQNDGPKNGGCQDCRGVVTINSTTGAVTRNEEYYALGHASKFVRAGAVRIESGTAPGLPNVAFLNPDGTKVLVVLNDTGQAQSFRVRYKGRSFSYTLAAGAVASLVWQV